MNKILVTYATWTGTTRTVAEAIAETLRAEGTQVDVRRSREVRDLSPYQAVVVGTSVHGGRLPGESLRFVRRHHKTLGRMPVAEFLVCLAIAEDTPENRQQANGYLAPLYQAAPEVKPVDVGIFAGTVLTGTPEFKRLFFFLKFVARSMAQNTPDHRNWDAIRAWATGIKPALAG